MDMYLKINFQARRLLQCSIGGYEHSTSKHGDGVELLSVWPLLWYADKSLGWSSDFFYGREKSNRH